MKITVMKPVEVVIQAVRIVAEVPYGDGDMPFDFPHRRGDTWDVTVDIDTGKIREWPAGVSHLLCMKVVDSGSYYLIGPSGDVVASREGDYVPDCVPGSFGDYIELDITEDGTISNWDTNPDVAEFF